MYILIFKYDIYIYEKKIIKMILFSDLSGVWNPLIV